MTFSQVNSSTGKQGDLTGEKFAGDHGPEGVFSSLKGSMLSPMELSYSVEDKNMGPDRLNQEAATSDWVTTGPIQSGEFNPDNLTRGGSNFAH